MYLTTSFTISVIGFILVICNSFGETTDVEGHARTLRMLKFIRAEINKYKDVATDLPFLHVDDGIQKPSCNQTCLHNTTGSINTRRKRGVIYADKTMDMTRSQRQVMDFDAEGPFIIRNVDRITPQHYDGTEAIDINFQKVDNKNLVFSIEESEAKKRTLVVYELVGRDMKQRQLMSTKATDAVSVDVVKIKNDLFAFTTVKHDPTLKHDSTTARNVISTGSALYRVNLSNNTLERTQVIHMPFTRSSVLWNGVGEKANDKFLVIAPTKALTKTGTTYDVSAAVYRWRGAHYDLISNFSATNPQSIEHFNMLSHDYLAVANYQDNTGSTDVESEILKYQYSEDRFISFQKIRTHGAKDIKHFAFESSDGSRKEHFIAVANSCKKDKDGKLEFMVQSTIMKFDQERFFPFKSFYAYGAQQFLPLNHNGRFVLALADFHGIRMMQYNGWTFVETFNVKYDTVQNSPFSMKLRQFNHMGTSYLTVASNVAGVRNGLYAVNFETRNDHRKLQTSVEQWCLGATRLLNDDNLLDTEKRLNEAPKLSDERVVVKGSITFKKGVVISQLRSRALRMGRAKNLGTRELNEMTKLGSEFKQRTSDIDKVKFKLDNVVFVDRDQEILGSVVVQGIDYTNSTLNIAQLQMEKFGSTEVSKRLQNLVFVNKQHNLKRVVVAEGTLHAKDISVETLNGHPLGDYALRNPNQEQVFTGTNKFLSDIKVTDRIQVKNSFAGVSFSRPNFLVATGNQTFPDVTMTFTGTKIKNLYTIFMGKHNLPNVFQDAVPLTGGVIINAEKRFKQMSVKHLNVESLNNVNINDLYKNAIYTDQRLGSQTFTTPKHFESVVVNNLSPANPIINKRFDLSSSFINIESGKYTLKHLKLERSAQINHLQVNKRLNDIQVKDGKLDVLLKNSAEQQHVKSKTLKAVDFRNHVTAREKVDGVELHKWSHVQNITLEHNVVEGHLQGTEIHTRDHQVTVGKSFSLGNTDVLNVLRKSARLDSATLPGSCTLELERLEVEGNSAVGGLINDKVKPSDWVVNSDHKKAAISGEKTFARTVHFQKDIRAQALFGQDKKEDLLKVFPTLLMDGPQQVISQPMTFTKSFRADSASCPKTKLDGVEFGDVLFKSGDQIVEVESTFRNLIIATGGTFVAENASIASVNDINLSHEVKDTLRTKGSQVVTAPYTFDNVKVEEGQIKGSFAGSDVKSVFENIVLKNGDAIDLDGSSLIFEKKTNVGGVDFVGHVNGIPHSLWGNAWMLSHTNQDIHTKVEFLGPVTATDFLAPTVNTINVKELSEDIVRIDRDETIESVMEFQDPVTANSGVIMPNEANVNGMNLERDILLKTRTGVQTISGSNNFMKGMSVGGNVVVNEMSNFDFPNFVDLHQASNNVESRSEKDPISLVINGNAQLDNEPHFKSQINEHHWQNILDQVWFREQDVVLQHPVKFSSVQLDNGGVMSQDATLNGQDLKNFEDNYASKSRDNVWTGSVTFKSVEKIERMETDSLMLEPGALFGGENIQGFYDSVLRYSSDQTIRGHVNSKNFGTREMNTKDAASFNSVDIKNLMTISGHNELSSSKKLGNIVADKIVLSPDTVIDGVNMGNWNENAVRKNGDFDIKGPVQLEKLETTDNIRVAGLVDGVQFNVENILTSDQNQEILGPVTIKEPSGVGSAPALKAPAGVVMDGTLNGIDVKKSISNLVFTNVEDQSPIVIKSGMVFDAPVSLKRVETKALLQGQDVSAVLENFKRANDKVSSTSFSAQTQYEMLANMAAGMMTVAANRAVFLGYYVLAQIIQISDPSYVKVLHTVGYPAISIGFKRSESITTENWWAYNAPLDYYQLQVGNRIQMEGTVVDIAELEHEKGNLFAFAVNSEGNSRPAQAALEVMNSIQNFEMNKSPDKMSKTFILKTVDAGTPFIRPAISQILYSNGFKSLRSFSVTRNQGTSSCMIATTHESNTLDAATNIYCLDKQNGILKKVQELDLDSPSLTTATTISNTTFLGILTRTSSRQPEGLLEIWNSRERSGTLQFVKHSCLPVFNVVAMDALSTKDGKTFLAVASGAFRGSDYRGSVFIYRSSQIRKKFVKVQTIEIAHPVDVKMQYLQPSKETVVYVLSKSLTNNVHVYKYKGLSGWELVHEFTSENGKSLQVADFWMDNNYRAQVLVTSPKDTKIYAAEFKGISNVVEEERAESQSFFLTKESIGLIDDK